MKRPNLFVYAPSELSQDAFIAWLAAWADEGQTGALHEVGKAFIDEILGLHGIAPQGHYNIDVLKQREHIDVLLVINKTWAVIIEDKTHTSEHNDQLARYQSAVKNNEEFKKYQALGIFLKTGDQCDYSPVEKQGYKLVLRKRLLPLLESGIAKEITSDIYCDYVDHLREIDMAVESYKIEPVNKWKNSQAWIGFFEYLRGHLGFDINNRDGWHWVHNAQGGFYGFYWFNKEKDFGSVYLQLEAEKLCVKIYVKKEIAQEERREFWIQWADRILQVDKETTKLVSYESNCV